MPDTKMTIEDLIKQRRDAANARTERLKRIFHMDIPDVDPGIPHSGFWLSGNDALRYSSKFLTREQADGLRVELENQVQASLKIHHVDAQGHEFFALNPDSKNPIAIAEAALSFLETHHICPDLHDILARYDAIQMQNLTALRHLKTRLQALSGCPTWDLDGSVRDPGCTAHLILPSNPRPPVFYGAKEINALIEKAGLQASMNYRDSEREDRARLFISTDSLAAMDKVVATLESHQEEFRGLMGEVAIRASAYDTICNKFDSYIFRRTALGLGPDVSDRECRHTPLPDVSEVQELQTLADNYLLSTREFLEEVARRESQANSPEREKILGLFLENLSGRVPALAPFIEQAREAASAHTGRHPKRNPLVPDGKSRIVH